MPFTAKLSASRFDITPDIYEAVVVAVDEVESQYTRPDGSRMVDARWEFEIVDGSAFHGAHVRGYVPPFFQRDDRCKLYRWACAALGVDDVADDYTFTDSDVVGKTVHVLVTRSNAGPVKVGDVLPANYVE